MHSSSLESRTGSCGKPKPSPVTELDITLAGYATRWLVQIAMGVKPRTAGSYAEILRFYVLPTLGRMKGRGLHRGHIKTLLTRRSAPPARALSLSHASVRVPGR